MHAGNTSHLRKAFVFIYSEQIIFQLDRSESHSMLRRCMFLLDECIHAHQVMLVAECTRSCIYIVMYMYRGREQVQSVINICIHAHRCVRMCRKHSCHVMTNVPSCCSQAIQSISLSYIPNSQALQNTVHTKPLTHHECVINKVWQGLQVVRSYGWESHAWRGRINPSTSYCREGDGEGRVILGPPLDVYVNILPSPSSTRCRSYRNFLSL